MSDTPKGPMTDEDIWSKWQRCLNTAPEYLDHRALAINFARALLAEAGIRTLEVLYDSDEEPRDAQKRIIKHILGVREDGHGD